MTVRTRPNRYRHGVVTALEFAPLEAEPSKARKLTKGQLRALEAIQMCLRCELESCDEKKCRRK